MAVRSLSSTVEVPLAVEAFWLRLARATAPPLTPPPTMAQARHRAIGKEGVQPFLGFLGLGAVGRGRLMGHTAIGRIAIAAEVCPIFGPPKGALPALLWGRNHRGGAFVRACVGIYRKGLAVGVGSTGAIGAAVPLTAADGTLSRLIFGV